MNQEDTTEEQSCGQCNKSAGWTWHDGFWPGGRYCETHIRDKLISEESHQWPAYKDPITTEENVTLLRGGPAIIPAGAQPIGGSFPTIRSKEAFDAYLEGETEG